MCVERSARARCSFLMKGEGGMVYTTLLHTRRKAAATNIE